MKLPPIIRPSPASEKRPLQEIFEAEFHVVISIGPAEPAYLRDDATAIASNWDAALEKAIGDGFATLMRAGFPPIIAANRRESIKLNAGFREWLGAFPGRDSAEGSVAK